jgi:uncharacterized protein DUF6798
LSLPIVESPCDARFRWRWAAPEIVCLALLFAAQAAWPPPEPNEPHYLGKAKHYWNPDWAPHDFFFNSADTHRVFYVALGWLSRWLPLDQFAWCGRIATWILLAWAWRRLSWTIVPRPGWAFVSGFLFLSLNAGYQLAGEWVVGGFEAKPIAYVLVFLALAELARDRWNAALALLGAASAFHVLVGGWAAAATGCCWLLMGAERPPLKRLWPGLLGGLLLALPGLWPALALDAGVDRETAALAHEIYVFKRLRHHLLPQAFSAGAIATQLLMVLVWAALNALPAEGGRVASPSRTQRIRHFVIGALAIELAGMAISLFADAYPAATAGLLRMYWFRLADAMLPLGIALAALAVLVRTSRGRRAGVVAGLAACVALAAFRHQEYALTKLFGGPPRTDKPGKVLDHADWKAACDWIAGHTPSDATFLTPRNAQTFTWYAGRGQVVSWKDIPQDSRAIVEWRRRLEAIYGTPNPDVHGMWFESLAERRPEDLRRLGVEFGAAYLLCEADPPLALPRLYQNNSYAAYSLLEPADSGMTTEARRVRWKKH